jgi:hypothetical protein
MRGLKKCGDRIVVPHSDGPSSPIVLPTRWACLHVSQQIRVCLGGFHCKGCNGSAQNLDCNTAQFEAEEPPTPIELMPITYHVYGTNLRNSHAHQSELAERRAARDAGSFQAYSHSSHAC